MASRRYNTYKFRYTSDIGRDTVRLEREYLDANNQPLTPITQLFLARVLNDPSKWEPKKRDVLRHGLSYIQTGINQYGEFKSTIPYSDIPTKSQHLREIEALQRVICVDYVGETMNYAK